jgi:hypothetical protein
MEKLEGLVEEIAKIGGLENIFPFVKERSSFVVIGHDEQGVPEAFGIGKLDSEKNSYVLNVWNSNIDGYEQFPLETESEIEHASLALYEMCTDHSNHLWKKDF